MKLCNLEGSQEATQEKPQLGGQTVSSELVVERDYLRFLWPEDPDPFVVVWDKKKLDIAEKQFPGIVIYSWEEIKELQKIAHCPGLVKSGHLVKKKFLRSEVVQCIPVEK